MDAETTFSAGKGAGAILADRRLAQELSERYLLSVNAYWSGANDRSVCELRLARFWRATLPPRPRRPADAFSPHGGGGRGIHWYETSDAVLGYIDDVTGGYVVPPEITRGMRATMHAGDRVRSS